MNARPEPAARSAPLHFESLPPLTLYAHLPWCVRKCPYCDFNSYEAHGELPERAYVDALLRDLDGELEFVHDRPLQSVFIGGGTPSLFSGAAIRLLIAGVRERAPLGADAEITLEANPGAVDAGRFGEFRDAGVNRLSIGVQSLRGAQLRSLGRVHGPDEALRAVELARAAGFANLNLDLMYALPGDDVDGALGDLAAVVKLAPAHVSWYQLTLEPNTAFHRNPPPLPGEEMVVELERRGRALLAAAGYRRYEISAYAQKGRACTHNLNYWEFGDYLGIGAGAHGKTTRGELGAIERRAKTRNPRTYLEHAGSPAAVAVERLHTREHVALEFLLNALRLPAGVSAACYEQRAGQPASTLKEPLAAAIRRGWMSEEPGVLRATPAGLDLLNALLGLFLP